MYNIFNQFKNPNKNKTPEREMSPMQTRLLNVVHQYSSSLPDVAQALLSTHLHGLADKMDDEKILFFITHTRDMLEFIETGVMQGGEIEEGEHHPA